MSEINITLALLLEEYLLYVSNKHNIDVIAGKVFCVSAINITLMLLQEKYLLYVINENHIGVIARKVSVVCQKQTSHWCYCRISICCISETNITLAFLREGYLLYISNEHHIGVIAGKVSVICQKQTSHWCYCRKSICCMSETNITLALLREEYLLYISNEHHIGVIAGKVSVVYQKQTSHWHYCGKSICCISAMNITLVLLQEKYLLYVRNKHHIGVIAGKVSVVCQKQTSHWCYCRKSICCISETNITLVLLRKKCLLYVRNKCHIDVVAGKVSVVCQKSITLVLLQEKYLFMSEINITLVLLQEKYLFMSEINITLMLLQEYLVI